MYQPKGASATAEIASGSSIVRQGSLADAANKRSCEGPRPTGELR